MKSIICRFCIRIIILLLASSPIVYGQASGGFTITPGYGSTILYTNDENNRHIAYFDYYENGQAWLDVIAINPNGTVFKRKLVGKNIHWREFRIDRRGTAVVYREKATNKLKARRFTNNFGYATPLRAIGLATTDEFGICRSRGGEYVVGWVDSAGNLKLRRLRNNLTGIGTLIKYHQGNAAFDGKVVALELYGSKAHWPTALISTLNAAGNGSLYLIRFNKDLSIKKIITIIEDEPLTSSFNLTRIEAALNHHDDEHFICWLFGSVGKYVVLKSDLTTQLNSGSMQFPRRHSLVYRNFNGAKRYYSQGYGTLPNDEGENIYLFRYRRDGSNWGTIGSHTSYEGENDRRASNINTAGTSYLTIYQSEIGDLKAYWYLYQTPPN